MPLNQKEKSPSSDESMPAADTGNASNPSPYNKEMKSAAHKQLLDEKAEKYLRESGNIEDMPDALDQQEMDEIIKRESPEKE